MITVDNDRKIYENETYYLKELFVNLKPKKHLLESQICKMTEFSAAPDNPCLNGNTILLELELQRSSENKYMHISGSGNFTFITYEKILNYESNMGYNMISYPIAMGEKKTYFLYNVFEFIKNEKLEDGVLSS